MGVWCFEMARGWEEDEEMVNVIWRVDVIEILMVLGFEAGVEVEVEVLWIGARMVTVGGL